MKRQHPKVDESSSDEDEGRFQEAAVDFKPPVKGKDFCWRINTFKSKKISF